MNVRPAIVGDLPVVQRLQREWAQAQITHGYRPPRRVALRRALGGFFWVAEHRGRIVGFTYGSRRVSKGLAVVPKGCAYLDIEDVYVTPRWRNRGVGRALIDAITAAARERNIRRVMVYSATKDMRRLLRFYEQLGFKSWFVQLYRELKP